MKKVIVADVPEGIKTIRDVMGSEANIVEARTLEQAQALIKMGANLIVCGIHFSDSRMFDLVRLAKADPMTRAIPLVCFRDMNSELSPPVFEGLQIACRSLGSAAFVDLFDLKSKFGTQEADKRFRQILLEGIDRSSGERDLRLTDAEH